MSVETNLAILKSMLENHIANTTEDRIELQARLKQIEKDLNIVSQEMTTVKRDITEVKPIVAAMSSWSAKLSGALIVLGALGSLLAFFVSDIRNWLLGSL